MEIINLTGQKFGRLTVLNDEGRSETGHVLWRCRCDCGKFATVNGIHLRRGDTKSCGCLRAERPPFDQHKYKTSEKFRAYNRIYAKKYNTRPEVKARRATRNRRYKKSINGKISQKISQKKRLANPKYRLSHNISTGIYRSLKGNKKSKDWEKLINYSLQDVIKHLEKQFQPGMTWDNYGKWHIDHKIPISVFNFTDFTHVDFKRCWALKNLQPMWEGENVSKGSKPDKPFQASLCV